MPVEINFPRDSTLKETNRILRAFAPLSVQLDGTAECYKRTMRQWFIDNGALEADSDALTKLCDKWYTLTCVPFHGWIDYVRTGVSAGTQGGDFVGMVMEPSTDTFAGRDDFAGNPLFAPTDCNWVIDAVTKSPKITAIDGITPNFRRNSPDHFVGVLQATGYYCTVDLESGYQRHYASLRSVNLAGLEPLKEAQRPNGDVSPWVVHSKYPNHTVNGKMTSYAGVIPTAYSISHNTCHTLAKATGEGYSGMTMADKTFLLLMGEILTASMTFDGKIQGCCNYNYQYPAAEAESGVKRIILENEQAKNLEVGSGVIIGNYAGNLDRGQAAMYSISGNQGAIITAIEPKGDKTAVYVDVAEPFDTAANGASTEGTTYISTFLWPNGSCDGVLGNNGSLKNNTSGKYPGKIQGIEYMCGAYSVLADAILKYYQDEDGTYWAEPYICSDASKQASSITEDYKASGIRVKQPSAAAWCYIVENGVKNGVSFPINAEGGSSSTYTRDAAYLLAETTGSYELRLFCSLDAGAAVSGLSALLGNDGLTGAGWNIAGWLSPNGNRGEWAA